MNTQTEWRILTDETEKLIEFGIQKKWFFRLMDGKGVLEKPIIKPDWLFVPFETDSTIIPEEATKRLEAVKSQFCVRQVIVGHEIVEAPEIETPVKERSKRETTPIDIPWKGIATIAVTLAAGFAYVLVSGVCLAFSALDPCLIVVLDDSDGTWVSICEWLD
jgi:hypothetical protein